MLSFPKENSKGSQRALKRLTSREHNRDPERQIVNVVLNVHRNRKAY